MRSTRTFWIVLCLFAATTTSARALAPQGQDPPRDLTQLSLDELLSVEVVSAASRYEQRISEAPATVTVVTAEEIDRHGYRTLGELLQYVRGLYITSDRNYSYVGVRGFGRPGDYNGRVLLMIDGHRLNDNLYGSAGLETSFGLDLALVDRVEIVRGPGSSLYGTNAVFAVINVVTRRPSDSKGLRAGVDRSSFQTTRGDLSFGKSFGRSRNVLVAGNAGYSAGQDLYFKEFDRPETNQGMAVGTDADRFGRFYGRASYGDLSVQGTFVSREKVIPTASFGTLFNDGRTRTIDSRGYVELEYEHRYGPGSALVTRVSYDESHYRGNYVYAPEDAGDAPSVLEDFGHGRWLGGEIQRTVRVGDRHRLTAGSEVRWDVDQDQGSFVGETVYLDDRRSSTFAALFAQDEYRIAKGVRLHAGVRYDHYSTFGGAANPRLAVLVQPSARTTVKLMYGRAFRAPTAYELYYHDGGFSALPSLKLDSERARTYEVSLDQRLGPWLHAAVSMYDYQMEDLISYGRTDEDLLIYRNLDRAHGRGMEVEIRGRSPLGLSGTASYAYQRTHDQFEGELSNSPRHLGTVRLTVPMASHRAYLASDTRYLGSRLAFSGDVVGASVVSDVTLTSVVKPRHLELSFSVYNLFDRRYADPASSEHVQIAIPQDGRSWRLGLSTRF